MVLNKSLSFNVGDYNCELRTLNESDVNQNYIRSLKDQKKYDLIGKIVLVEKITDTITKTKKIKAILLKDIFKLVFFV